jgi:uncharacterized lipoprotein YmbA
MPVRRLILALPILLAGCASSVPQYRYYTLDMTPHAQASGEIELASVRIGVNQALSKPEILIRTSPTSVEYYALDRWASGLDEQITEKLKTEFAGPAPDAYRVSLDATLMAFEQVDSPSGPPEVRVKLDANFVVRDGKLGSDNAAFNRLYTQSQSAQSASPGAVVEALSRAVEAIATEMAADVQQMAESSPH